MSSSASRASPSDRCAFVAIPAVPQGAHRLAHQAPAEGRKNFPVVDGRVGCPARDRGIACDQIVVMASFLPPAYLDARTAKRAHKDSPGPPRPALDA